MVGKKDEFSAVNLAALLACKRVAWLVVARETWLVVQLVYLKVARMDTEMVVMLGKTRVVSMV